MNEQRATSNEQRGLGRTWGLTAMTIIASLHGFAREGSAQQLTQQSPYSTHDWTAPVSIGGEPIDYREFWADVKTPGDGFAYTVGTIEVQITLPGSLFSQQPSFPPPGLGFTLGANNVRQVVMLQRTDTATQQNTLQRFYFGSSPVPLNLRSANARGISVWPADTPEATRVVICGETYDQTIPLSQDPVAGFTSAVGNNATGFIAVYDGALTLLWTHHFFGTSAFGECAVTDVSVRVIPVAGGTRDVITYCGISTFGNPAAGNAWLTPVQPFAAPASTCGGGARGWANGNSNNAVGQWDGFVGRISRDSAAAGATVTEFHSVVGGAQQDGLFGLSELEDDKFAVCGSSASAGTVSAGLACPGVCVVAADTYCLGTVFVFDAAPVASSNPLLLEATDVLGQPGGMNTLARDVLAQPRSNVPFFGGPPLGGYTIADTLFVVGSTDDSNLAGFWFGQQTAFSGPTDGFIATYSHPSVIIGAGSGIERLGVEFQGLQGPSGYTGVNAWNEYANHAVVTGYREQPDSPGVHDIDVASYYMYTDSYTPPATGQSLRLLTRGQLVGSAEDRPTAMGPQEVTQGGAGPAFQTFGLENHAGGGVAQDASGRVQVVGTTLSLDFNALGGGRPRSTTLPTPGLATMEDAVRSVLDLLPYGVRRTDGTGNSLNVAGLVFPPPGTDGGTTPPCGLMPFGRQIGVAPPPLAQTRLLIDFDGPPPAAGTTVGVVVVRTPAAAGFTLAALQIGFPGVPGLGLPLLVGSSEIWAPIPAALMGYAAVPNATFHEVIVGLPPPPAQFTIQVAFLLGTGVEGGIPAQGIPCGGTEFVAVTPALYIDY
ncbi:MAG: hypothetical protein ABL997_09040 [Planctomycetota bacterium]